MENLKLTPHIFILLFLFLSKSSWSASHSGHDHKDYTDCLYETGTGNLNVDQVLCADKGCACYTKVFKNVIDGLKGERTEIIQERIIDTHAKVVTSVLTELTDINTLFEKAGGSLLGAGSAIKTACTFDSLQNNLSCKNEIGKKIANKIKKIFDDKADLEYGLKENSSSETPYQCLTNGEVRGVTLLKERSKHMGTIYQNLSRIPEGLIKKLMSSENPLDYLELHGSRKERSVLRSLNALPILKTLFQSKEGVKAIFSGLNNKTITEENFEKTLTTSGSLQLELSKNIADKCHQIFKSIDKLACQKIAHPYVADKDFNFTEFGYREDEPDSDLETHLFSCQGKECLKDISCTPKGSKGLDSNDLLADILGKDSVKNLQTKQITNDSGKKVNRRICALLVCGDESHGETLFTKQVNSEKGSCSPKLNPKRTPMEAYALLKCPDNEVCHMPEMEDFKAYLDYFKSNMVVETETIMVAVAGKESGTEGSEVEQTITRVSKKNSTFIKNFLGEVGQDLDGFFETGENKTKALAEKKLQIKSKSSKTNESSALAKSSSKSKGKVFETQVKSQSWEIYNSTTISNNNPGSNQGFRRDQIGSVNIDTGIESLKREESYAKTAQDAISTASKALAQSNKLQEELRNARSANSINDNSGGAETEITSVANINSINSGYNSQRPIAGKSNTNQIYMPAPYTEADIPTEKTDASSIYNGRAMASSSKGKGEIQSVASIPGFEISHGKLNELNQALIEDFKMTTEESFMIKVSIGKGKKKKMIPVMVENVPYKGKLILRPIKEVHNQEIFLEVLASPLFENYRTILAIREERKKFFNEVLPGIKRI
jgi:hypothetical protein